MRLLYELVLQSRVDAARVEQLLPFPVPLDLDGSSRVSALIEAAEEQIRRAGAFVRVGLVISTDRDQVVPRHETVSSAFEDSQLVRLVADVSFDPPEVLDPHAPEGGRIPVTILTGFLGAGKTTLLNHLLYEQRERRIAVIENEFGAVPIDQELISTKLSAAEQIIVMDNGCMCCAVRGDILDAFASVASAVAAGRAIDAVLIETSGLADPVPIVRTLLQTREIASAFRVEGVLTVVDARHVLERLGEPETERTPHTTAVEEARRQIL